MADIEVKHEAAKAPERWEPFSRLLDWPAWPAWFRGGDMLRRLGDEDAIMRVEEFMDGSDVVVRCEMPGVDPAKDVEVTVANGVLNIRAERRKEERDEAKGRYRSEFHYGSLRRALPLPAGADSDDVKATYADGVLEVRVHVDESRSTKVPITRV